MFYGYRDASDAALEPLGGLKGHPAMLLQDWLSCQFETPYVTPCTLQDVATVMLELPIGESHVHEYSS